MIPKIIHYVWLGDKELPEPDRTYIAGWKKLLPDWKFKCWGSDSIKGLDCAYLREALAARHWAFASDYVRLYALATEGGIYLDTDVELKSSLTPFLENELFLGFHESLYPLTALIGSIPHHPLIEELLAEYASRKFIRGDGVYDVTTNLVAFRRVFRQHGVDCQKLSPEVVTEVLPGVRFYPSFVLDYPGKDPSLNVAHHHCAGTWLAPYLRKQVIDLPFGFRLIRLKVRRLAKADDPLPLLAHERKIATVRLGRKAIVLAKVAK